jgi:predicted RNase H-like HicB family nuclease
MKRDFTLEYWLDEGWYVGRLREVPGVFSQGETMDELVRNIEEVYHMMLAESRHQGRTSNGASSQTNN